MKKKSLLLFFLSLILGSQLTTLKAQQLDPVKWSFSVKETSADEAELVFTAKLDAG